MKTYRLSTEADKDSLVCSLDLIIVNNLWFSFLSFSSDSFNSDTSPSKKSSFSSSSLSEKNEQTCIQHFSNTLGSVNIFFSAKKLSILFFHVFDLKKIYMEMIHVKKYIMWNNQIIIIFKFSFQDQSRICTTASQQHKVDNYPIAFILFIIIIQTNTKYIFVQTK